VQGDNDCHSPRLQLRKQAEDLVTGVYVETSERLVHEHDLGLLRESPGDEQPLLLPSGERLYPMIGEIDESDIVECLSDKPSILGARSTKRSQAAGASHHDNIADADRKTPVDLSPLGYVGDADVPPGSMTMDLDCPGFRRKDSGDYLEKSTLAGPVWADYGESLSGLNIE